MRTFLEVDSLEAKLVDKIVQQTLASYAGMDVRRRDDIIDSHITRTVLDMEVEGVSPRGRPKLRYRLNMDTIRRYIKNIGLMDFNILDCSAIQHNDRREHRSQF